MLGQLLARGDELIDVALNIAQLLDRARLGDLEAVGAAIAIVCKACGKSFTLGRKTASPGARFARDVVLEAVRLYVQGLPSYRVLSRLLERRLGRSVSRVALNRWVHEVGEKAKTPLEVSRQLRPAWGGFLGVDGKVVWVRGDERCLLLGVDQTTQDVVHALLCDSEGPQGFVRLVTEAVVEAGYPLQGIVADLGPGFLKAHRDYFPRVPLQACRVHFDRRLDQYIRKAKRSTRAALHAELKDRIRAVLYAPSEGEAASLLYALLDDRGRVAGVGEHDALGSLHRNFGLYMTHHRVAGLPADNNITENVVKQLGKKLRLMEGFHTDTSAESFTRLLVGCYRFKRFTDSSSTDRNGMAPLELAGVDLAGRDWLTFLVGDP